MTKEIDEQLYRYPGSQVLRNKLDIREATELEYAEYVYVNARIESGLPLGNFDLDHLCSLHRHLFQDVYEWAGKIRQVEIFKGASRFIPPGRIEMGMWDVHGRLVEQKFLCDLNPEEFAQQAGKIIGDINHVHPFREGNGRTQLLYLKQLTDRAGHEIDLTLLDPTSWIAASQDAHHADYSPMRDCIHKAMTRVDTAQEPEEPTSTVQMLFERWGRSATPYTSDVAPEQRPAPTIEPEM